MIAAWSSRTTVTTVASRSATVAGGGNPVATFWRIRHTSVAVGTMEGSRSDRRTEGFLDRIRSRDTLSVPKATEALSIKKRIERRQWTPSQSALSPRY
jgi:hypothetical protein